MTQPTHKPGPLGPVPPRCTCDEIPGRKGRRKHKPLCDVPQAEAMAAIDAMLEEHSKALQRGRS